MSGFSNSEYEAGEVTQYPPSPLSLITWVYSLEYMCCKEKISSRQLSSDLYTSMHTHTHIHTNKEVHNYSVKPGMELHTSI